MEEKKITWRMREVDFYRVAEAESWLCDMAEKGLLLESAGLFFCSFEKTVPRKVRYRLEPRGKDDPSDDYVEACAEMGWELVDCWRNTFLIWKCERSEVPEFHTDPFAESYAFKRLTRNMMWNSIISILGFLLIFFLVLRKYWDNPITQLISDRELFSMIFALTFIWSDLEAIRQWISMSRLTKALRSGENIHERVPVKHKRSWLPEAIYLVSAFMTVAIPFWAIGQSRTGPANRFDLMVPRLQEIEESAVIKEGLVIDGIDYGNFVRTTWAFLAPQQLELHEQGYTDEAAWEEWHQDGRKDSEMPITYKAKYYGLRYEFLAEPLLDEKAEHLAEEMEITFEPVEGGEKAWYGVKGETQHLLVKQGKNVVHLQYRGLVNLLDCMDIVIDKLDS